jgi:hypothetical protein
LRYRSLKMTKYGNRKRDRCVMLGSNDTIHARSPPHSLDERERAAFV